MFNAILLNKNGDGTSNAQVTQLDDADLPADGDVTVRIDYSTINYKDGLAITVKAPIAARRRASVELMCCPSNAQRHPR